MYGTFMYEFCNFQSIPSLTYRKSWQRRNCECPKVVYFEVFCIDLTFNIHILLCNTTANMVIKINCLLACPLSPQEKNTTAARHNQACKKGPECNKTAIILNCRNPKNSNHLDGQTVPSILHMNFFFLCQIYSLNTNSMLFGGFSRILK